MRNGVHICTNLPIVPLNLVANELVVYKELHSEPLLVAYVMADISPWRRSVMAAIHGSCFLIAIETGRFLIPNLPLNDRLCIHCDQHMI